MNITHACNTNHVLCVQLFQAEQRLQRSQQQLKDLRQAAADANPESEYLCPAVASARQSCMGPSRTKQRDFII